MQTGDKKEKIEQVIIVEGRDDTNAVHRAVDAETIETHGFGITRATYALIEAAASKKGIIILTDPDYSGEEIRRRIAERFPDAKHAYIGRRAATSGQDIGVENAAPEAIISALRTARKKSGCGAESGADSEAGIAVFCMDDLIRAGLVGKKDSASVRAAAGEKLGIGYGNARAFLRKLNAYAITSEEFDEAVKLSEGLQ